MSQNNWIKRNRKKVQAETSGYAKFPAVRKNMINKGTKRKCF